MNNGLEYRAMQNLSFIDDGDDDDGGGNEVRCTTLSGCAG